MDKFFERLENFLIGVYGFMDWLQGPGAVVMYPVVYLIGVVVTGRVMGHHHYIEMNTVQLYLFSICWPLTVPALLSFVGVVYSFIWFCQAVS